LSSFSFLDGIDRIAARGYEPSDSDVLRARLRTVGVQEYKFTIKTGKHAFLFAIITFSDAFGDLECSESTSS
jgi:hypothetical protein